MSDVTIPAVGDAAPDFCLPSFGPQGAGEYCLADKRGKWVIVYFYSKDNTSG